ncbi:MAG: hypothetical protein E3J66_06725, partial [Dehalococcoidia bacterium]
MTGPALSVGRARTNLRKWMRDDATMVENLSKEQLQGILETIPVEISFVDDNDLVQFWNKHETRIFKRPVSVIGKPVQNCHPKK